MNLVVWGSLFSLVLLCSTVNCIRIPKLLKLKSITIIPQGWAFFTRDPQEDDLYVYKIEKGQLIPVITHLNEPDNFFGLKRFNKGGIEIAFIEKKLMSTAWVKCQKLSNIIVDTLKTQEIKNEFICPTYKGTYILQRKPPIPFVWAQDFKGEMYSKIAKIKITI